MTREHNASTYHGCHVCALSDVITQFALSDVITRFAEHIFVCLGAPSGGIRAGLWGRNLNLSSLGFGWRSALYIWTILFWHFLIFIFFKIAITSLFIIIFNVKAGVETQTGAVERIGGGAVWFNSLLSSLWFTVIIVVIHCYHRRHLKYCFGWKLLKVKFQLSRFAIF